MSSVEPRHLSSCFMSFKVFIYYKIVTIVVGSRQRQIRATAGKLLFFLQLLKLMCFQYTWRFVFHIFFSFLFNLLCLFLWHLSFSVAELWIFTKAHGKLIWNWFNSKSNITDAEESLAQGQDTEYMCRSRITFS